MSGTAIVGRLLASDGVADLQVVLQLEVAERLLAGPGSKTYGPLSVIAALRARGRRLRRIPPGAFRPRPKVTVARCASTFATTPALGAEVEGLLSWLFVGLASGEKQLAGVLGGRRALAVQFLVAHGHPPDARAEMLSPDDWLALARALESAAAL